MSPRIFAPRPSPYAAWANYAIVAASLVLVGLGLRMLQRKEPDQSSEPTFRALSPRDLGKASSTPGEVSSLEYIPESPMPVIAIPKLTEPPEAPAQRGRWNPQPPSAPPAAPPAPPAKPKFSLLPSILSGGKNAATSSAFMPLNQPEKKKEEKPAAQAPQAPAQQSPASPEPAKRTFITVPR